MADMQSSGNKLLDAFTSALSSFGAREQYEDSRLDLARQGINTYNKQVGDRMVGLVMYLTGERDKVDAKKTLEENRISDDIFKDKLLKQQETAKNDIVAAIVSAGMPNKNSTGVQNSMQKIEQSVPLGNRIPANSNDPYDNGDIVDYYMKPEMLSFSREYNNRQTNPRPSYKTPDGYIHSGILNDPALHWADKTDVPLFKAPLYVRDFIEQGIESTKAGLYNANLAAAKGLQWLVTKQGK